ncbi:hypothetical protein [Photobacterium lipolyticum]|uniref:hypothetical protein n=1 Tax=Photobacterium lipolyticum TaxID=266810 RepID=UPI0014750064|nr:hypothetical protein [Photobacterium lipolyticum]
MNGIFLGLLLSVTGYLIASHLFPNQNMSVVLAEEDVAEGETNLEQATQEGIAIATKD